MDIISIVRPYEKVVHIHFIAMNYSKLIKIQSGTKGEGSHRAPLPRSPESSAVNKGLTPRLTHANGLCFFPSLKGGIFPARGTRAWGTISLEITKAQLQSIEAER